MAKYKIIFDGEEEDDVFDTREEAEEHALYLSSCARTAQSGRGRYGINAKGRKRK